MCNMKKGALKCRSMGETPSVKLTLQAAKNVTRKGVPASQTAVWAEVEVLSRCQRISLQRAGFHFLCHHVITTTLLASHATSYQTTWTWHLGFSSGNTASSPPLVTLVRNQKHPWKKLSPSMEKKQSGLS